MKRTLFIGFLAVTVGTIAFGQIRKSGNTSASEIPKTWDDEAVASLEVPLAEPGASPKHVSADYYYRIPVRPIYKDYPVYHPSKEPSGYLEWLKKQEPEIIWSEPDSSTSGRVTRAPALKTEADWIRAGEIVFNAPIGYDSEPLAAVVTVADVRDPVWYQESGTRVAKNGMMPFARYVVRKKGRLELGTLSCGMCHTRLVPDRAIVKGAQGNYPFDRDGVFSVVSPRAPEPKDLDGLCQQNWLFVRLLFASPWLRPDPNDRYEKMSWEEMLAVSEAIPPGVVARNGTSVFRPVQVPDLIGIKETRYFDHTGLVRHRSIGDLMRYAASNQGADLVASYAGFIPADIPRFEKLPDPAQAPFGRYSDEQLYALAKYIYSLTPPPNPNKFDALAARGQKIFDQEGCRACHTPPLYTSNKLTPAEGFKIPEDHLTKYDIVLIPVGTNPDSALKTRRGTGYYKVPSLKGVWYRGPFEHNGSAATLEDWFDPQRLRDEYVPTGFKGYGVKTRAVKGHTFGLDLLSDDRKALIAFLKTL